MPPIVTPILPPPGASTTASSSAPPRDYPFEGYDATARQRVDGWVNDARSMFVRAGVVDPDGGQAPRVEWGLRLPAAQWAPTTNRLTLGEDPRTGTPFSRSRDVVAHEYAHAVLTRALHLREPKTLEAATINESLADTFAAALDDDWSMGEDLYPGGHGLVRSMDDPARATPPASYGVDRLPAHMRDWTWSAGNEHVNMGVPSRAAALIGDRLGRADMARLYVSALTADPDCALTVAGLAAATHAAAGSDQRARGAVRDAWKAVGVPVPGS